MSRVIILVACAMVLLLASIAQGAAVPQKINYQAVLLDEVGDPVTDPVNLTFSIYDQETGGSPLWTQTLNGVQPDANGQFSVILGEDMNWITHDVLTGGQLWLGIQVQGDAEEMSPRTEMVSAAYSFRVNTVDQAEAGTVYGPLTIEESLSKAADAQVIVTCSAKSPYAVKISPCDGTMLQAIDNTDILGEWGILAPGQTYIGMTDYSAKAQGAAIKIRPPSVDLADVFTIQTSTGDPTFNLQSDPDAGAQISFYTPNLARASKEKTRVGNLGLSFFGADDTEELLLIEEETPGVVSITGTDYSAKAAGASVKVRPPTATQSEVFTVSTSTGDPTFNLQSDPDVGAQISFYTPNLARASKEKTRVGNLGLSFFGGDDTEELLLIEEETPGVVSITGTDYSAKAAGASVKIRPPTTTSSDVFTVSTSTGDPSFQLQTDPSGATSMSFENAGAKISNRLLINNSGLYFVNVAKGETLMTITSEGNVIGKGQIAMGQNVRNDGDFANVLGFDNVASGDSAAVLGGYENTASGYCSVVAGGRGNLASGLYSFVAGRACTASVAWSTVGGGGYNSARNDWATVGGGRHNYADGNESTIAGGHYNYAHGYYSAIGGGQCCTTYTTCATVPGGRMNSAKGHYSFAAGNRAKVLTDHDGTFVWADATDTDFASTDEDQFLVRANNGVGINLNDPTEDLDIAGTARLRGITSTISFTYPYVVVNPSTGKLYKRDSKSSRRYKKEIRELGIAPEKVLQMEPVRFAWKENDMEDVGLIAEDVAKLIPELVIYDEENRPDGVKYDKVVLYLLAALKDMKAENDALKAHQTSTDAQLSKLTELVEILLAKQNDPKSGDDKLATNR